MLCIVKIVKWIKYPKEGPTYKSSSQGYNCNFTLPFGNMLFPICCQLNFSTEYPNTRQNIRKKFWDNLVDIESEAWLNTYWEYIKGKLFAVHLYPWSLGWIVLVFLTYVREGGPLWIHPPGRPPQGWWPGCSRGSSSWSSQCCQTPPRSAALAQTKKLVLDFLSFFLCQICLLLIWKKKVNNFPIHIRDVTNQTLLGRE